ncbi:MAG: glycosyltransferase family 4 protein [Cyanobacteria bacterium P01_B01_bin.77]
MININSFCFGYLGVQKHGYNFITALSHHDDIALFPWDSLPPTDYISPFLQQCLLNAQAEAVQQNLGIGIGVMNRMPHIVGNKKIAFTVWETSKIPAPELAYLTDVDEIWVPSTWGKTVLENNGIPAVRIQVVPEGVDTMLYCPQPANPKAFSNRRFRFLCVGKWEKRKGLDILLQAFANEFSPDESVELVVHCHNSRIPNLGTKIKSEIAQLNLPPHAPLRYSSPVPEPAMVELYNSCDAFVLPSRAEGWGLPIIEAMACAKPVIVTNHSAYLDFVNLHNGYLVNVKKMVKVEDPDCFTPDLDYGEWAEPDGEHLQYILRDVFEHPDKAKQIGQVAREDVSRAWTWDHAATKAWQHIQPC